MSQVDYCEECDRPMRPRGEYAWAWPGTVARQNRRTCQPCADAALDQLMPPTRALVIDVPLTTVDDRPWDAKALCAQTDPESFFPEKGGSTKDAKRVCTRCEVRLECLDYAVVHDEKFGIWGGMSERQRRKLKRGRAA